jgi:predicted nucleotidyltransferase
LDDIMSTMDLAAPYSAICPTLDSAVLNVLAHTSRALTGREVARLLRRRSHSGVLGVLHRLAEHGLVDQQEVGPAFLFALNREHLAAPAVDALANMRSEFLRRLERDIDNWEVAPINASLYGSAARGSGDTHSDIDILLVRPREVAEDDHRWRGQIDGLARHIRRWTGNHAGLTEVAHSELERLRREERPIIAELNSDAITLYGEDLRALLAHA